MIKSSEKELPFRLLLLYEVGKMHKYIENACAILCKSVIALEG